MCSREDFTVWLREHGYFGAQPENHIIARAQEHLFHRVTGVDARVSHGKTGAKVGVQPREECRACRTAVQRRELEKSTGRSWTFSRWRSELPSSGAHSPGRGGCTNKIVRVCLDDKETLLMFIAAGQEFAPQSRTPFSVMRRAPVSPFSSARCHPASCVRMLKTEIMCNLLGGLTADEEQKQMVQRIATLPMRLGGLGLRSSVCMSHSAYWASWADSSQMISQRLPTVTAHGELGQQSGGHQWLD